MMSDNHIFYIILALMLIYLLWMDLALYFKLQSGYDEFLVVQNYKNLNRTVVETATIVGNK